MVCANKWCALAPSCYILYIVRCSKSWVMLWTVAPSFLLSICVSPASNCHKSFWLKMLISFPRSQKGRRGTDTKRVFVRWSVRIRPKHRFRFSLCYSVLTNKLEDILIRSNEMEQYAGVYLLQNYCTCFECLSYPSSGVHQTVTVASGTGHSVRATTFR